MKLYGGFEYILFRNPSDDYPEGFTTIGNYNVPPGYVNSTAYDNNKILRVFWTAAQYAVRDDIDVASAFYHYYQNDYNTSPCTDGGLSASSCAGTLNALSAMIDYRPAKRLNLYAGVMYSGDGGPGERLPLPPEFRPDGRPAPPVLVYDTMERRTSR